MVIERKEGPPSTHEAPEDSPEIAVTIAMIRDL